MDKLIETLSGVCPGIDFASETDLVDDGLITSLDIVMIVTELMAVHGARIDVDDLTPENFRSAETIYELVRRAGER